MDESGHMNLRYRTDVPMSMDELAEGRRSGSMSAAEWEAWEELDGFEYLIG